MEAPSELAAIDMNIFIDLVTRRPEGRNSRPLQDPWVTEEIELVLTDEVLNEINKAPDKSVRRVYRTHVGSFRQLNPIRAAWQPIYTELKGRLTSERLNARDQADLRHVARAIAGGATYLVTRDDALVRRWATLTREAAGIQIVHPHTLLQVLDQRRRTSAYAPAHLEGTDLELKKLEASEIHALLDPMVAQSEGERGRDLRKRLESLVSRPNEIDVWSLSDQAISLATWAEEVSGEEVRIPLLRLRRVPTAHTLARHILFRCKLIALSSGAKRVLVSEPFLTPALSSAMSAERYVRSADAWEVQADRFVGSLTGFRARLRQRSLNVPTWLKTESPPDLVNLRGIEIERQYWPAKILDAPLDTFVIPIKPAYAEALYDLELAKQTLFYRDRQLGLSREHVYYRNPKGTGGLSAPARILWYVTSRPRTAGTKQIVACSRLEEVSVGPPRALYQRFRHLGIYRLTDVLEASPKGEVMALRFTDTELFSNRVGLGALERMARAEGHGLFLQGPWKVSRSIFESIYRQGTCS
jgi:predicted nucleic acid-binding protein